MVIANVGSKSADILPRQFTSVTIGDHDIWILELPKTSLHGCNKILYLRWDLRDAAIMFLDMVFSVSDYEPLS
jgi:hypothetical protein